MIHQTLERSDDPASQCYLQKSPSQLPFASWTQHLCTGKIKTKTKTKSFAWTTATTGRPHQIGSLRSVSHFTPPPPPPLTLDKHTCFFSQISYDRPPNGRVQYSMTVATVGTDSHDPPPHCTLPHPPHLHKHPGDDCFQVTTWPPENAHGSSPCIYPHVKWVKGASLKHMI